MSSTQVSKPTGPLEKILVTGATSQQPIKEAEEVVEEGDNQDKDEELRL